VTNRIHRPTLFLDVDGVVLRRRSGQMRARDAFEIAPHPLHFLRWVIKNFDVRWLSSRCQGGDAQEVCHAFRYALGARDLPLDWRFLETIPAARWGRRKVDAIDLSTNFYWVDDAHGEDALAFLGSRGRADRAIETNVDRDPDALLKAMHQLADAIGVPRYSDD
jgi:hypothetical protein